MKAIINTRYGSPDIMKLKDLAKPIPKDDEVLVKIQAASVNAADWHILKAEPFIARLEMGFLKPKYPILGSDIAGVVEAVGKNVREFKAGDEVFGILFSSGFGGFAEYVAVTEKELVLKPPNLSFEQAAAVPLAGITAVQGLRDVGSIQARQQVLINGASGGVGTFAVQIAKSFGAEVTAVCSTRKVEMVRSLGADHVIDYTREDFTRSGKRYDLIVAVNGYHSLFDYRRALKPHGNYVMIGGTNGQMFQALILGGLVSKVVGHKMAVLQLQPHQFKSDLAFLKGLLEAGQVVPIIDRCYPLAEVPDAIRYVDAGHALGKVVISVVNP